MALKDLLRWIEMGFIDNIFCRPYWSFSFLYRGHRQQLLLIGRQHGTSLFEYLTINVDSTFTFYTFPLGTSVFTTTSTTFIFATVAFVQDICNKKTFTSVKVEWVVNCLIRFHLWHLIISATLNLTYTVIVRTILYNFALNNQVCSYLNY